MHHAYALCDVTLILEFSNFQINRTKKLEYKKKCIKFANSYSDSFCDAWTEDGKVDGNIEVILVRKVIMEQSLHLYIFCSCNFR